MRSLIEFGRGATIGTGIAFAVATSAPPARAAERTFDAGVSLSGASEDNLFASATAPESDFVTRLMPRLGAGWRSERFSIEGRAALDAERFRDHPDLDSNSSRRSARFDLSARPGAALGLALHAAALATLDPSELNGPTGIQTGRRPASRLEASPSASWRLGARDEMSAGYAWSRDEVEGGAISRTGLLRLGLAHDLTPRDRTRVDYLLERYDFEAADTASGSTPPLSGSIAPASASAQAVTIGWERQISPRAGFELRGGPRWSDGSVDAEVSIALHRALRRGSVAFACGRTLATVAGLAGAVSTDSVTPSLTLRPARTLSFSVAPAWLRSHPGDAPDVTVTRLDLEVRWEITAGLAFAAGVRRSVQDGILGPSAFPAGARVERDTIQFGLVARTGSRTAPGGAPPAVPPSIFGEMR